MRQRTEDQLAQLVVTNRAMAGGEGFRELQQVLRAQLQAE